MMNPNANRVAATLLTLLVNGLSTQRVFSDERLLVNMTIVWNASTIGAYCLDGSLPAYHLHRGFGAGVDNWFLQFEGCGLCNDVGLCLQRAKTCRGSTWYMTWFDVFSGILSDNASLNRGKKWFKVVRKGHHNCRPMLQCKHTDPAIRAFKTSCDFEVVLKERRKKWDEKNQEAIANAVIAQDEFDQVLILWYATSCMISGQHYR